MREKLSEQLSKILVVFLFFLSFLLIFNINDKEVILSDEELDLVANVWEENNEEYDYLINNEVDILEDGLFEVIKVVDGDTIKVNINGEEKTVRLIGINTPEVVDPRKTVECFGREASAKAKEILENKKVKLESDFSQDNYDRYGRLLRYVYLEDGLFFNEWMIENGYAFEYTYELPYQYQTEFKNAQRFAQDNKMGLWADGVCDYFTESNTELDKEEVKSDSNKNLKDNLAQFIKNSIIRNVWKKD
ncbi:MAG: thermonuclease family protein [Patescibacteria group bacterium]|jgi:micrococcal nuclease|nr:thermonuclease family protein [bacterium]HQC50022.1 thermonuclease family protein [bacterium]